MGLFREDASRGCLREEAPLNIATWNLREAIPSRSHLAGSDPLSEIVELLDEHSIDVVACQEVPFSAGGEVPLLRSICQATALPHVAFHRLSPSSFTPGSGAGLAVVSRFPITWQQVHRLPNPRLSRLFDGQPATSHDKGGLAVTISLPTMSFSLVNVHMFPFRVFHADPSDNAFEHLWSALGGFLQSLDTRLVLAGDFNSEDRTLITARVRNRNFSSCFVPLATSGRASIDDVLFTPHFELLGRTVISNFSDHKLCIAHLRRTTFSELVVQNPSG